MVAFRARYAKAASTSEIDTGSRIVTLAIAGSVWVAMDPSRVNARSWGEWLCTGARAALTVVGDGTNPTTAPCITR